jgi:sterol desaturase/sphingolipid hydroxylase (fatty acid hydroxylase superfamily)
MMTAQSGRILLGALDRIVHSSANYWVAMLSDVAAALAFLALGLSRFSGPRVVAGGVVIVGFMSSGLLEYVVHRWILHGPPSMARRGHAQHHVEPKALISTPLFVVMTAALVVWGLLELVLPTGVAALLVFGLYAGYNYFALVHHWQHHRGTDLAGVGYLRRLERLHHLHHHRQVVNFGISTMMWDRLFGTFQPPNAPATNYVFCGRGGRGGASENKANPSNAAYRQLNAELAIQLHSLC